MEAAAAPSAPSASVGSGYYPDAIGTTSYAKVMESAPVSQKVDEAAAPVMQAREQVLAKLRDEHAIGVVVAVRGDIIWADLFANTNLLSRYWTKLVRSYAAESLTEGADRAAPSVADAQHFLDAPTSGSATSDSEVGVYRYSELTSGRTETFVLESLLPGTGYDVHISKMKMRQAAWRAPKPRFVHPEPMIRPEVPPSYFEPEIYR
jgi:ARG and Rhodanese-Phosphatase-superfamily-associated Protein domain